VRAARYSGLEPYLSSTLDGPWGIAAALQLASSERLSLACGLATLELFDTRLARTLPRPRMGLMSVPGGPGLGVEVDPDALQAVTV
jgi:L-alanine-DL-glutamate epimerase-like enolase superfamily enzyme